MDRPQGMGLAGAFDPEHFTMDARDLLHAVVKGQNLVTHAERLDHFPTLIRSDLSSTEEAALAADQRVASRSFCRDRPLLRLRVPMI